MNNTNTIFALSSGAGKSGVAVIRISGNELQTTAQKFINKTDIKPRHAYFANLQDEDSELIDQCLVLYFKAPNSFTGEDLIEIQTHGAPAVIQKIFDYLPKLGMRMATPGEFSRRAFYNNKMDLADADGLSALLSAQTEKQRKLALQSMTGFDSKIYESWRAQMIEISAYAAAILDYPEDDLPKNIADKLNNQTKKLYDDITHSISGAAAVHAIRSGFNIVLTGKTNVGKSSVFNRLVGESRAIVSDIHGTTRDVVSHQLDIDGYLTNLSDTAGVRKSSDAIEKIGIEKTCFEIKNADLILHLIDNKNDIPTSLKENEILVMNKSDLNSASTKKAISISATTGFGIDKLLETIKEKMHSLLDGSESDLAVNARTKCLLTDAQSELKNALANDSNFDIFSEHVRMASDSIGKILGTIGVSEIADRVFSGLCLGK